MAKTQLGGNSHLSEMQRDATTGAITGFDIINPNNTKVHVDLSLYAKTSQSASSANVLKEAVYKNYQFLAEHVPAATAVFENNAKQFPNGIVWAEPQKPGLWAEAIGKGATPAEKTELIDYYSQKLKVDMQGKALMTGNLTLPGGGDPLRTAGGTTHEDAFAQDYLGKDGKWYKHTPQEALMHEHAHLVPNLQNFNALALQQRARPDVAIENLKLDIRLENEGRAIEFVNAMMMKPLGVVERDPNAYQERKPADAVAEPRSAYSPADIERLHQVPIPKALEHYSHPVAEPVQINKKLYSENAGSLAAQHLAAVTQYVQEALPVDQQAAINARLRAHLSQVTVDQQQIKGHEFV